MNRRSFLSATAALTASGLTPGSVSQLQAASGKYKISLAEWSIHKAIESRMISNLEFPRIAREHFGIEGLEFVNALWGSPTHEYVQDLKKNIASTGTKAVLIMVDGEGWMGHAEKSERMSAVENHKKWIDIAAELGCHSIRTNMYPGEKQPETKAEIDTFIGHCVESFSKLCEYAATRKINVIIENHGGVSSLPDVVVRLMKTAKQPNLGTLPDFGNFYAKGLDRYEAVRMMLPYAKGVSFKVYYEGPNGSEKLYDIDKMMKVVFESAYTGYIGIEYEGSVLTEFEGIARGKKDLDRLLV